MYGIYTNKTGGFVDGKCGSIYGIHMAYIRNHTDPMANASYKTWKTSRVLIPTSSWDVYGCSFSAFSSEESFGNS